MTGDKALHAVGIPVHPKLLDVVEVRVLCGPVEFFHDKPENLYLCLALLKH